jgi:hypothetical protein
MLNNLSEQIRECYRHAEDCARKAAAEPDPKLKRDFLDLEPRWLLLARNFKSSGRLISAEAKRRIEPPMRVRHALHIRFKDGNQRTDFNQRGELPKLGESLSVTLSGEQLHVRVRNVLTPPPANEHSELAHYVYAVEI